MADVPSIASVERRLRAQVNGPCPEWLGGALKDIKVTLRLLAAVRRYIRHRHDCALVRRSEYVARAMADGDAVTDILVYCDCGFDALLAEEEGK